MKIKIIIKFLTLICFFGAIAGCSSTMKSKRLAVPHATKKVEKALLESAGSIQESLAVLAREQETTDPALIDTIPLMTPEGGLGGKIDIDWTGPIAPLVYKIAKLGNYKLKILGNEPSIPIIVSVTNKNAVIADVLKNASLQARNRASVVVFLENKIIELRYKSV